MCYMSHLYEYFFSLHPCYTCSSIFMLGIVIHIFSFLFLFSCHLVLGLTFIPDCWTSRHEFIQLLSFHLWVCMLRFHPLSCFLSTLLSSLSLVHFHAPGHFSFIHNCQVISFTTGYIICHFTLHFIIHFRLVLSLSISFTWLVLLTNSHKTF